MILDVISDSIEYTFSNPKNILKLGIFELLSVFIFPVFIVSGYQYKIIDESLKAMIHDEIKMAEFNDFRNLFLNGVKLFFAKLFYIIVPIIGIILVRLDIFSHLIRLLILILYAFLYCFAYIALSNMIFYNSFKKAFDFREIACLIKDKIGFTMLFGVFFCFALIYYSCGMLLDKAILFISNFINVNYMLFSYSLSTIITFFITGFIIQPFMHILVGRISGLIYISSDD